MLGSQPYLGLEYGLPLGLENEDQNRVAHATAIRDLTRAPPPMQRGQKNRTVHAAGLGAQVS